MIGIDIGRVIISGDTDITDQFFGEHYLDVPPVKGAFEAIKVLVEKHGADKIFLVSKCSNKTQLRTLDWLEHHSIYSQTHFARSNVHFCRARIDKKKICENYGIQRFVDDRFSVLAHLKALEELLLFNPSKEELKAFNDSDRKYNITMVKSWKETIDYLLRQH